MKIIILFFFLMMPSLVLADDEITGIGRIAANMLEPVNIVSDFVCTASIIIGISCLFGALLKYMQHRVNPLVSPISTIIVLLAVGIMLVSIPFAYLLTENGIPYSLLR